MSNSTAPDKYAVISKALEHFAQRAITIKTELLQKTDSDYYPYGDLIFDLLEKDMALVPKKAYELISTINRSSDHSADSPALLKLVKQEEKLISASLSLYQRDLEGIHKALEHRGLSNFEMPQIEQQIALIDKVVTELHLKLPTSARSPQLRSSLLYYEIVQNQRLWNAKIRLASKWKGQLLDKVDVEKAITQVLLQRLDIRVELSPYFDNIKRGIIDHHSLLGERYIWKADISTLVT